MQKSFTVAALFIFLFSFFHSAAQIPFELNSSGHIIIKAKIDNVEGKFIFDTGAGLNAVFKKFSQKLKSVKTNNFFVGHRATGEALEVELYNAKSFMVNNRQFKDQQYAIIDLEFGDIDGLISLQPFRDTPVTIDYINKQIFFNQPTKNAKSIAIQIADFAGKAIDVFTYVQLNDSLRIQVLLDSGAGKNSFWFSSNFLKPLALNKADFKTVAVTGEFNKQNNYYIGKLSKLTTANGLRKMEALDVAFIDGLIHEGKTSIDWLGKVLTIDIAAKKIYISK
jgi:hypothetical protein